MDDLMIIVGCLCAVAGLLIALVDIALTISFFDKGYDDDEQYDDERD